MPVKFIFEPDFTFRNYFTATAPHMNTALLHWNTINLLEQKMTTATTTTRWYKMFKS